MVKILVVIGTRPEAIKMAPVITALRTSNNFEVKVCSTSQHQQMLSQVFEFFNIAPDYDLNVMEPNQSLSSLASKILDQLSNLLREYKPDWILVQGDTTTAMVGALAGFHEKIKVAHIEAGLRSNDMYSPFPEEVNRTIISRLATAHFCPTENAVNNLKKEGIEKNVFNVGNTVVDSVIEGVRRANSTDQLKYSSFFDYLEMNKKIILVTCHRRENFGKPFVDICKALVEIADLMTDYVIVYPVHLNPNILDQARSLLKHSRIFLIDPLSYSHFLWILDRSEIVLTDSGGVQEEAPSLNKPVVVLREVTERVEGVESGTAILVGTNREQIVKQTIQILKDRDLYSKMANSNNPYGDGKSAQRILSVLKEL